MKRNSYRDRDYPFGRTMLTLRDAMRLSQEELARSLGVSRRAVGDWEAGSKYPRTDHLKQFITLVIQQKAFPPGHESQNIRALWQAAHQKVLLNEAWLASLFITNPSDNPHESTRKPSALAGNPLTDWGEAITGLSFYGREWEINLLDEWVSKDNCQVVSILGLGGIGKSSLAVSLMRRVAEQFDVVIWRSLRDLPTCEALFDGLLQSLLPQAPSEIFTSLERRLSLLLDYMRNAHALIVLDNLESVLEEDNSGGRMRPGYEALERFLRQSADTKHQSCLLLTSREKPGSLIAQEGNQSPVRALRLARLDAASCESLLAEKGVTGTTLERAQLIEAYTGNPLALKIVGQTIADLFAGEIAPFLEQGEVIFGGIHALLAEQIVRLSKLEQTVLVWLAILREATTFEELLAVLVMSVPRARLLEAIQSLYRHSLVERGQKSGSFTLQSVVLEYMTAQLITDTSDEVQQGQLSHLVEYGLETAHRHEYVRQTQERLIVAPILARLLGTYVRQSSLEEQLLALLQGLSTRSEADQGYGPTNLAVLLRLLRGDLRGVDFSHLVLRDIYLQGVDLRDGRLVNATIRNGVFTQSFDAMTSVTTSPTGKYWAASSMRGEIRIWEAGGHLLHQAWLGHVDMVWGGVTFSPDGSILASGGWDGMVKLWQVASERLIWSNIHSRHVNRVAFAPNGLVLASAGNDSTVRLWDVTSGKLLQILPHPHPVMTVAWSPDGLLLSTGDTEGGILLWAMNQKEPTVQMRMEHKGYIASITFAPDGHTLASGSWDCTVKLWEIPAGRLLQTLIGHSNRVASVVWSPDGDTLAISGFDQTILLWNVKTSSYRAALRGHSDGIYNIAFTPDSRNLLSTSLDGTLRVWDVVMEQCIRVIHGYADPIYDVDWSPDSTQLVSGGTDQLVTIWDITTEKPIQVLHGPSSTVIAVGWNPDGHQIVSSETEHAVRLWDLTSSAEFQLLQPPYRGGNYAYHLAWSSDGQRLASGTHRHGMLIWNVTTGEESWIGHQLSTWIPYVAWSPNNAYIAGGGEDGIIYTWNTAKDSLLHKLSGHYSTITSLVWSHDGMRLASGSRGIAGGELFIWDMRHGERVHTLVGHPTIVNAIAWGSSEEIIISGDGDGTLRWWQVQGGECLLTHHAHQGMIRAIKRSPDGTKLASCGDDGAIMLWDLESGEWLQTIRRDRPYERWNITGIRGLTDVQKANLHMLGAIEDSAS